METRVTMNQVPQNSADLIPLLSKRLPATFTNDLGMQFVLLPSDTFFMSENSKNAQRQVTIPSDFYMAVFPVTQGQWQDVMKGNPSFFSREGEGKDRVKYIADKTLDNFPVEKVSWHDAQKFIEEVNKRDTKRGDWIYRLPTEMEWEYSCRGGTTFREDCSFHFYFEEFFNDLSSEQANFDGKYPFGGAEKGPTLRRPSKVGSYKPNRLGIYDMHGIDTCKTNVE
jgi:formylglycine-generating enzyme required for sulfatase activity